MVTGALPNAKLTPGAVVTTDVQRVCRPGYASSVRPRGSEWQRLKDEVYTRYGIARGHRSTIDASGVRHPAYEVDHLVPLEIGGAPADLRNLWPEPIASAHAKDRVEDQLRALVCSGRMPIEQAQSAITHDWRTAVPR